MEPASDLCCPPPPPNGPSEHPGAGGREALARGTLDSHPFLSQNCSIMVTICVSRSIYIHGYINKHKNMDKASQFKYMDIEIKIENRDKAFVLPALSCACVIFTWGPYILQHPFNPPVFSAVTKMAVLHWWLRSCWDSLFFELMFHSMPCRQEINRCSLCIFIN